MSPEVKVLKDSYRHDVVNLLEGDQNIGVELGVAKGVFSQRMVNSRKFSHFIGVDMYADEHDTAEYKEALSNVGLFQNYKLLRMRFDEAIDLFDDQSLDFLYVDGYAHSGEEGGQTIFDWCKKVKIGGYIAGDDYHEDWPLVVKAVNEFVTQAGFELLLTDKVEKDNPYCRYPTWVIKKCHEPSLNLPQDMFSEGIAANKKVLKERQLYSTLRNKTEFIRPFIPKKVRHFTWDLIKKIF